MFFSKKEEPKIDDAEHLGVKDGSLGELVNQECMAILESYKSIVELIHNDIEKEN